MEDLHKHDDAERHEVLKVNAAQKRFIQPPAEAIPETPGRLPSTHHEDHHEILPDILDRIETLEEKSEKPLMHLQDMAAGGVKLVDIGGRCEALEGKVTDLRERIPAGTGILGLKEDADALEVRLAALEQWQTVFSELVARISVLEGVVLKLTLGQPRETLLNAYAEAIEELCTARELNIGSSESRERERAAEKALPLAREALLQ